MNKLNKEPRRPGKLFALIIILLGISILGLVSPAILNRYRETAELVEQLRLARSEKEHLVAIKAEGNPIRAEWERLFAEKDRLDQLFPLEKELPFVLVELEEAINRLPVEVSEMRAGEKTFAKRHGAARVNIAVISPPAYAASFLERVKDLAPFIVFDSITWTYTEEKKVIIDMELEIYYIVPELVLPLLERPVPGAAECLD